MTGLADDKLTNQKPDNCPIAGLLLLCRVSESVQYQLDVPAPLSNVWPRKNKTQKYTAAAENSTFLAKFGLDRESEKLQEIVWHQM